MMNYYNRENRRGEDGGKICVNYKPEAEVFSELEEEKKKPNIKMAVVVSISLTILILIAIAVVLVIGSKKGGNENYMTAIEQTAEPASTEEPLPEVTPEAVPVISVPKEPVSTAAPTPEPVSRRGTAEPIPQDIREYMTGKSYRANNNITFDQLSYLTIPHYDFNYNVTYGHLVVNASVAEDVLDIFAELFDIKYPIERMNLVDDYNASDFESIEANNTSAFNYRESTDGSGSLSKHALGLAIDINPQINPYVNSSGTGSHSNAREYWNRDISTWTSEIAKAAYIGPDTEIYRIFISHGWSWGGNWSTYRDYQHFTK